jgi:hypothetical protein
MVGYQWKSGIDESRLSTINDVLYVLFLAKLMRNKYDYVKV